MANDVTRESRSWFCAAVSFEDPLVDGEGVSILGGLQVASRSQYW